MIRKGFQVYLDAAEHKDFIPRPRYYELGDYLTYFCKEDRCLVTQVDTHLTLYHSIEDQSLVGIKLSGFAKSLEIE